MGLLPCYIKWSLGDSNSIITKPPKRLHRRYCNELSPLTPGSSERKYAKKSTKYQACAPSGGTKTGRACRYMALAVFSSVVNSLPASYSSATFALTVHLPFCVRSRAISAYGRPSVHSSNAASKSSQRS